MFQSANGSSMNRCPQMKLMCIGWVSAWEYLWAF